MKFLFLRKFLLIWREGCGKGPLSTGLDITAAQKRRMERGRSVDRKIRHLPFLLLFFFRFFLQYLHLTQIWLSNKWHLSHEIYELSQYKIALDKGILLPSITTHVITDLTKWWLPPAAWTSHFRKLFFNYYNRWFFK